MRDFKKIFKLIIPLLIILSTYNVVFAEGSKNNMYKEYKVNQIEEIAQIIDKEKQNNTTDIKIDLSNLSINDKTISKLIQEKSKKEAPFLEIHELYGCILNNGNMDYTVIELRYNISSAKRKALEDKLDNWIKNNVKDKDSEYLKIKKIHDYIINNTVYLSSSEKTKNGYSVYSPLGVFIDGQGVCDGYAEAFQMLAKKTGLESYKIIGDSKAPSAENALHAWNLVKIGNYFYHVDVTWDDSNSTSNSISYKYFLKGDKQMSKTHVWDKGKYAKADRNYSK